MSEDDLALVRRCQELWARRDFDGLAELADPEFVLDLSRNLDAEVHRGMDGLRTWTAHFGDIWDDFRFEIEELFEVGDQVVSSVRVSGTGRASGVEAEMRIFQVWNLREGRVLRVTGGFRDREEAIRDAQADG